MEIIIKGTAKEIADLVRAIQDRQFLEVQRELEKAISGNNEDIKIVR